MTDDASDKKSPAQLGAGKRGSFSLRLLFVVMTLAAAGTAFAANYPVVAAILALGLIWEVGMPLVLETTAKYFGQGRFRRTALSVSLCFVAVCAGWTLLRGVGPAFLGVVFGGFFTFLTWIAGFETKK